MDTRSAASLSDPAGALERFSAEHGPEIEHLRRARSHTEERLGEVRGQLSAESIPPDISVAVFGSWARHELTEQSDDDWAVLVREGNTAGPDVARAVELAQQHLGTGSRKPGAQGIFGGVISCAELADKVGLQEDTNSNLTRRALLLLESVEVAGMAHAACRRRVLDRYLNYGIKDYRPPRFLLNDVVRYWRTIGVDFEGKHREGGDDDPKWVERNAKLRTSRKVLFAGGLIPILQCHLCERVRMADYLDTQLSTPPTDRLAAAFGHYGAIDEGVRFFAAYDRWIAILGDAAARRELAELRFNTRDASGLFAEIREIGETLDQSLITLLFDTALSQVARKYAVL
ncbi:MAG: hypothetical protein LC808_38200 [Actinobacteria bacterium]|nr:hypothetical protein [Actinomycetota bacterium]